MQSFSDPKRLIHGSGLPFLYTTPTDEDYNRQNYKLKLI